MTFPSLYLYINDFDMDAYNLKSVYTLSKNWYAVRQKSALLRKNKVV